MNNKTDIDVKYVSPLKKICMTIGELPASYLETMSYYEMLVWFVEFLKNQIIPTVNNNAEAVSELQALYEELRTYVNNYFDNLDVQDEINNKLEAMAESGQLTDIIAQYLGLAGMIAFDTVADMKEATNLVNGSKCQTLGYGSVNDGGNAIYKVRPVTNNDVIDEGFIIALDDDQLVAELVIDDMINVKQLGINGDNTTNDSPIIQKAIDKANLLDKNVFIPNGTYLIEDTLLVKDKVSIYGENKFETILHYTGTNYAIKTGLLDENTQDYRYHKNLAKFTILGNTNCSGGIRCYQLATSKIEDINLKDFGGDSTYGIELRGVMDVELNRVQIKNNPTLKYCILIETGYQNMPPTTITLNKCYLSYAKRLINNLVGINTVLNDCILESATEHAINNSNTLTANSCYFENNVLDVYNGAGKMVLNNPYINYGSADKSNCFYVGTSAELRVTNPTFHISSTEINTPIVNTAQGKFIMDKIMTDVDRYPTVLSGDGLAKVHKLNVPLQQITFECDSITGTSGNKMIDIQGSVLNSIRIERNAHIVGFNIQLDTAIEGGTMNVMPKINGYGKNAYFGEDITNTTGLYKERWYDYYLYSMVQDDKLQVGITYSGITNTVNLQVTVLYYYD